jgi:hypothetical protein
VSRPVSLVLALLAFVLVATANSGGYRYGVSDQAFYAPAVAWRADPSLFARDRAVLEPQMRLWLGDEWLGWVAAATGHDLPSLFAGLYLVTLITLAVGGARLARSLGCGPWATGTFLILLSLRHRIAKTGANSLEGYFHPRMLAFAIGALALAAALRSQHGRAVAWTIVAAVVHTTTAFWFAVVVAVAAAWPWVRAGRTPVSTLAFAGGVLAASAVAVFVWVKDRVVIMDDAWLAVLGEKDYLFSADWPAYAWITNLLYPIVLIAVARSRARLRLLTPGEIGVIAGLLVLGALFLVSVPLTEWRWALAVQLQVNRVFWVMDLVALLYIAWWLTERPLGPRGAFSRRWIVAGLLVAAIGRGAFVLHETERSFATVGLPSSDWTDAMRWLTTQPVTWHVLADPGHAWKYGTSVRVAAARDTLLESTKDTAFALYDRGVAERVAERLLATGSYDVMTIDDVRALDQRYGFDAMVDRADRSFDLPILYRNASFVVYDLR